jgi:hypothetical protein
MKNTINKRKPGRPTKVQSAVIAYARGLKANKGNAIQLNIKLGRELNNNPAVAEFVRELRASGRGLLATFAKDALIKAAISATSKS